MKKLLWLIFFLALFLRLYRVGESVFKEDEFETIKAAAYINQCRVDSEQCSYRQSSLKSKIIGLISNNETKPNLFAEIYLWDFVQNRASETHFNRAWSFVYIVALFHQFLGVSEFTSRLPSVIWGSLLVPVGYVFSRRLSGSTKFGSTFAFVLAVAFPLIEISRYSRMYSMFITLFLLVAYLWHRLLTEKQTSPWLVLITLAVTLISYWTHSLTLLLLMGVYIFSWFSNRRWFWIFSMSLLVYALIGNALGVDLFRRQYLGISWPPHWFYLFFPIWLGLVSMSLSKQRYLLIISGTYLITLIFFTDRTPGAAYTLALWPLCLLALVSWHKWLKWLTIIYSLTLFIGNFNYLYNGRDDRAQVKSAYEAIRNEFQSGDKIYAIQLRDYYLQDLPENTEIIDLQDNQVHEFGGQGFVVWEQEKVWHLNPEILDYVRNNFRSIGSGGVEIYRYNTDYDSDQD